MAQDSQTEQMHTAVADIAEEEFSAQGSLRSRSLSLYERVHEQAERFATTTIGQFAIERGDRLLKVVEQTAKWSLPHDSEKEEPRLARPLPWLPFLVLIVLLRQVRFWLSIGAILIGNEPVMPQDMVYFIQTRRRKLRAIRVHGLKIRRNRELEQDCNSIPVGFGGNLMMQLKKLLSSAICRPGRHTETERRIFVHRGQLSGTQQTGVERQAPKRPREDCDDSADANLTLSEMLTKYANEDSDDDSDFLPNPTEDTNESEGTTSSGTDASSSDETETDVQEKATDGSLVLANECEANRSRMPQPLVEIKQEKSSDVESGGDRTQLPRENGTATGTGTGTGTGGDLALGRLMTNGTLSHSKTNSNTNTSSGNYKSNGTRLEKQHQDSMSAFAAAAAFEVNPSHPQPHPDTNSITNMDPDSDTDPTPNSESNSMQVENDSNSDSDRLSIPSHTPPHAPPSTPNPPNSNASTAIDLSLLDSSHPSLAALLTSHASLAAPNSQESSTSNLTSASSSEDIFYSPIGSPPDFDCFQDSNNFKNSTVSFSSADDNSLNASMMELPSCNPPVVLMPFKTTQNGSQRASNHRNQQHSNSGQSFRQRGRNRR